MGEASEFIQFDMRTRDAGAFVSALTRGADAGDLKKRFAVDASTLSETPSRDPRKWGATGAYPRIGKRVTTRLLRRLYDEVGIYGTVVDTWAESTFAEGWNLTTADETWRHTAEELDEQLGTKTHFTEADRWMVQDGHAGLYYNLEDATHSPIEEPRGVRSVLRVQVLDAEDIKRAIKDTRPDSETRGDVIAYEIVTDAGPVIVHAARVLLLREFPHRKDPIRGRARVRPVIDDQLGFENVKWAAYESFWQRAAPYLQAKINPGVKLRPDDAEKIRQQVDLLQSGVIQKIVSENFELAAIQNASSVVNPRTYWDVAADSVSAAARIPRHLIFGTAAGALESASEDTKRFNARVSRRRAGYAAGGVRAHYGKLAGWGVLMEVPRDLKITWPSLDEPSMLELAEAEKRRAEALTLAQAARLPLPASLTEYEVGTLPTPNGAPNQALPPLAAAHVGDPHARAPHGQVAAGVEKMGREVAPADAPEIKSLLARATHKLHGAILTRADAYRALFADDPRVGPLSGEARAHTAAAGVEAADPEDPLVQALLGLTFDAEDIEEIIAGVLRASGQIGGLTTWSQLGRRGVFDYVDDTPIRTFRTLARMTSREQNRAIVERVRQSIADGLVRGEGFAQLRARVINTFEPLASAAEVIARTEAMRGYAVGSREAIRQAGVEEYEFSAYSDACPLCAPFDGRVYPLTDTEHLPPIHPNCRCVIVAPLSSLGANPS